MLKIGYDHLHIKMIQWRGTPLTKETQILTIKIPAKEKGRERERGDSREGSQGMILTPDREVKERDQEILKDFSKKVKGLGWSWVEERNHMKEGKFNESSKFSVRSVNPLLASKVKR